MKEKCCAIDFTEIDALLYKASVVITRNMETLSNVMVWHFDDTQNPEELVLLRNIYESVRRYYFRFKENFTQCLSDSQFCKLVEKLKSYLHTCKIDCRQDVIIVANEDWNSTQCRSASKFLKDIGIACEYVFEFNEVTDDFKKNFIATLQTEKIQNKYLYDFVMKTKEAKGKSLVSKECLIEYELLVRETCKAGFDYLGFIKNCKLDVGYSDKEVCITSLKTYTYLKNCGLSYSDIYNVVSCNSTVKFEYSNNCLMMIHDDKTYNLCDIRYKEDFTNYLTDCNLI